MELANGNTVKVEKEIELITSIEADKFRTYNITYRIMPQLSTDVVLGVSFLQDNEAIINFKEGFLTLDGKHYEILSENEQSYKNE